MQWRLRKYSYSISSTSSSDVDPYQSLSWSSYSSPRREIPGTPLVDFVQDSFCRIFKRKEVKFRATDDSEANENKYHETKVKIIGPVGSSIHSPTMVNSPVFSPRMVNSPMLSPRDLPLKQNLRHCFGELFGCFHPTGPTMNAATRQCQDFDPRLEQERWDTRAFEDPFWLHNALASVVNRNSINEKYTSSDPQKDAPLSTEPVNRGNVQKNRVHFPLSWNNYLHDESSESGIEILSDVEIIDIPAHMDGEIIISQFKTEVDPFPVETSVLHSPNLAKAATNKTENERTAARHFLNPDSDEDDSSSEHIDFPRNEEVLEFKESFDQTNDEATENLFGFIDTLLPIDDDHCNSQILSNKETLLKTVAPVGDKYIVSLENLAESILPEAQNQITSRLNTQDDDPETADRSKNDCDHFISFKTHFQGRNMMCDKEIQVHPEVSCQIYSFNTSGSESGPWSFFMEETQCNLGGNGRQEMLSCEEKKTLMFDGDESKEEPQQMYMKSFGYVTGFNVEELKIETNSHKDASMSADDVDQCKGFQNVSDEKVIGLDTSIEVTKNTPIIEEVSLNFQTEKKEMYSRSSLDVSHLIVSDFSEADYHDIYVASSSFDASQAPSELKVSSPSCAWPVTATMNEFVDSYFRNVKNYD